MDLGNITISKIWVCDFSCVLFSSDVHWIILISLFYWASSPHTSPLVFQLILETQHNGQRQVCGCFDCDPQSIVFAKNVVVFYILNCKWVHCCFQVLDVSEVCGGFEVF